MHSPAVHRAGLVGAPAYIRARISQQAQRSSAIVVIVYDDAAIAKAKGGAQ
jgi:hypothetical protein